MMLSGTDDVKDDDKLYTLCLDGQHSGDWEPVRQWFLNAQKTRLGPDIVSRNSTHIGELGRTPLHITCIAGAPADIIACIIDAAAETAEWLDSNGYLPVHYACTNSQVSVEVITMLVNARPLTKIVVDENGQTPLHCILTRNDTIPPEAISLLFDADVATTADNNGSTPLHLLCHKGLSAECAGVVMKHSIATKIDDFGRTPLHVILSHADSPSSPEIVALLLNESTELAKIRDSSGKLAISCICSNFKDGFPGDLENRQSRVCHCFDRYMERVEEHDGELLKLLVEFPDWLQRHALLSMEVQKLLNKEVSKIFPSTVLFLDLYGLILVVCLLQIIATQGNVSQFGLALLLGPTIYFFIRYVLLCFLLIRNGKCFVFFKTNKLVANNAIFDLLLLYLVFSLISQDGEAVVVENLTIVIAVIAGIAWFGIVNFCRNLFIDFAEFFDGVVSKLPKIFAFEMALTIILLAFAQLLLIFTQDTGSCLDKENDPLAFCAFGTSLLRVYTMSVGEIEEDDFNHSAFTIALYIFYVYIVIILLANILGYLVGNDITKNETYANQFWLNRLYFVEALDNLCRHPPLSMIKKCETNFDENLGALWSTFLSLFANEKLSILSARFWKITAVRLVACMIIFPLWFVLGLVSGSSLWPPQVRSWIYYVPCRSTGPDLLHSQDESNATLVALKMEIDSVKGEIKSIEKKLDLLLSLLKERRD